jgi:hypothetical protein
VGKKRPAQAEVLRQTHRAGKLTKTSAQNAATGERFKEWHRNNPHPRGMLGKTHSEAERAAQGIRSTARWASMTDDDIAGRTKKMLTTKLKNGTYAQPRKNVSWKGGWREISDKRNYYRSRWEANGSAQ